MRSRLRQRVPPDWNATVVATRSPGVLPATVSALLRKARDICPDAGIESIATEHCFNVEVSRATFPDGEIIHWLTDVLAIYVLTFGMPLLTRRASSFALGRTSDLCLVALLGWSTRRQAEGLMVHLSSCKRTTARTISGELTMSEGSSIVDEEGAREAVKRGNMSFRLGERLFCEIQPGVDGSGTHAGKL